ncbi:MAG TPA: hypothetical protein V6C97_20970 [Oculatellaceae cyanobacterium]
MRQLSESERTKMSACLQEMRTSNWFRDTLLTWRGLASKAFDIVYKTLLIGFGLSLLPGVEFQGAIRDAACIALVLSAVRMFTVPIKRRLLVIPMCQAILDGDAKKTRSRWWLLIGSLICGTAIDLSIMCYWPHGLRIDGGWDLFFAFVVMYWSDAPNQFFAWLIAPNSKLAFWRAARSQRA